MPSGTPRYMFFGDFTRRIEAVFVQTVIDLKRAIVLDGIHRLQNPSRFRIRSHDWYGPLPEVILPEMETFYDTLEWLSSEVAKLVAINRIRDAIVLWCAGGFATNHRW